MGKLMNEVYFKTSTDSSMVMFRPGWRSIGEEDVLSRRIPSFHPQRLVREEKSHPHHRSALSPGHHPAHRAPGTLLLLCPLLCPMLMLTNTTHHSKIAETRPSTTTIIAKSLPWPLYSPIVDVTPSVNTTPSSSQP